MSTGREQLRKILRRIDGKGYGCYRDLKGVYDMGTFELMVSHVQADPFAPPSRIRVAVPWTTTGWATEFIDTGPRRMAFEDKICRAFRVAVDHVCPDLGTRDGAAIIIQCNGQAVLKRNSVLATSSRLEVRCAVGLPARGRRINSREAEELLLVRLPRIVERSLFAAAIPRDDVVFHLRSVEDQDFLRKWIVERGIVAFVADGSVLPRRSGVDDRPLPEGCDAGPLVRFRSPDSLAVTAELPYAGPVRGMAIPPGVTLIVGGGFHGKSTLLSALTLGVYDHVPGDGRERVVADPTATKIRAEDGRSVTCVDLSPIIGTLPYGRDTKRFSTRNASGSTSQAAGLMEALEVGARVLLMDEDTCATNMMIRDSRMRRLVPDEKEPIVPFVDRVRALYDEHGVSTILVMGGAGDYFSVADTVIMMDSYEVRDVTGKAREIGRNFSAGMGATVFKGFGAVPERCVMAASLNPARGRRDFAIDARGARVLRFGKETVDLALVEQLIDIGQTRAIGWYIRRLAEVRARGEGSGLRECLDAIAREVEEKGLDVVDSRQDGLLAVPRVHEVAAAVNRMRMLAVENSGGREPLRWPGLRDDTAG